MQSEALPLVVDRAAASEPLAEEEFRAWARDQRVFISSVMDELREERRAIAGRLEALGAEPVLFERFGGRDDDPGAAYTHEVASSTIYVGILGRRYGRQLPTRYSATHTEYLAAEDNGLRVAVWARNVADREGHEQSFLEEVRTFHTTGSFEDPDQLAEDVERRLRRIAAEDLAPWVKLGHVILRARRITESAGRVQIEARTRGTEVLEELEGMRPNQWGRGPERRLTYAGRVRQCRLEDLAVMTTAARGADVTISMIVIELPQDSLSGVSLSEDGRTYSPEHLTELGLRAALFEDPIPLSGLSEHMARMPNPLEPLADLRLSEEVIRPIANLLLSEALVGAGKASRLTRFRLGPAVAGRRRLELAWQAPRRYQNVPPETRHIKGTVSLGV
jgi:Domain of unknown function (DUF4062)